ncbi:transporter [Halomonas nitroreducens]|uniref:Transporter n=1 Tax=Halomonas nitroreducens TaxID=447425 RepID=A0A431V5D2_9GAMM|nr:transporter [Halomonas nitroreducens]RTR05650.1 transporter [Halomonas nitroreducens]
MTFELKRLALACSLAPLAISGHAAAQSSGEDTIQPVGQRPPPSQEAPEVQAIPDIGGVLTPKGRLVLEPEFQYSHASVNRLTFRGVEILSTLQVGVLAAEDVDRDTYTTALTGRLGVTDRLELELRLPYLYRDDTANFSIEDPDQFELDRSQSGDGLGDVEFAAHYQINSGRNGVPYFVGNLRYKSTTGDGPFDVSRDSNGIEEELPTGSGFHSIEPSLTVLVPSAPAVYFANLGYLFNLEDDVNEQIGDVRVEEVDPGDAVRMSFGMSYSINPRSSFTLGYKNDFIDETDTTFTDPDTGAQSTQSSRSLNVGAMLLGWSYQFNQSSVLNLGLELGVTEDAPDTTLTLRAPIGLNVY